MKSHAKVVVIGGGVVGCSVLFHLARAGWTDVVLLGAFGAGVGGIAGLLFVANINQVADVLETITGQEVFDPTVYYFDRIPTLVDPWTVAWVVVGAILSALLPASQPIGKITDSQTRVPIAS